jgi:hypothetical protein
MTEQEDVNGNDPTMVAPAAGSIFPANCIEPLRQQNSRTVALPLMRQARYYKKLWPTGQTEIREAAPACPSDIYKG